MSDRRPVTVLLLTATVAAAVGGFGLLGWTALQGSDSSAAAAAQQHAGGAAEASWNPSAAPSTSAAVPVAASPTANAAMVATIRVPRLGADWVRVIRQGVGEDVLDSVTAGVGHYPATAMPGGVGNFAIAGHDTGWGDAFRRLGALRVGDTIRVEDSLGVYTYAFRNFRWVQPSAVSVLLPVPERSAAAVGARLITLTTCDPPYHAAERFVAYGALVGFTPAGGAARSLVVAPPDRAAASSLRAALAGLGAAPSRAAVVRAVRRVFGGRFDVSADRTSVGRGVPAIQIGVRRRGVCLIGQVGESGVRTAFAAPVAGRCLIGAPKVLAAG